MPPASTCVGDCGDDGHVTVDELVKGVVTENESLDQVEQAVRAVRAGSFRPPPTLVRPRFDRLVWLEGRTSTTSASPRLACLSTRECEILSHVARGETNKQKEG